MWFTKKKPEVQAPTPKKEPVYFQVVEEIPLMKQEINLLFEGGRSETFHIQEYIEDPCYSGQPSRYKVTLNTLRVQLCYAMNNKQEYYTFDDRGSTPTVISLKGVQKVWYSYPTEYDTDWKVYWIEEEHE